MKLHLSLSLFRALLACFSLTVALSGTSFAERVDSVIYSTHQEGTLDISENAVVSFENIQYKGDGAAIAQKFYDESILSLNDSIVFRENTVSSSYANVQGGAISNEGVFTLSGNADVTFSENTASFSAVSTSSTVRVYGGAIFNNGTFYLIGNKSIVFCGNAASSFRPNSYYSFSGGGAICNLNEFSLSNNETVRFFADTVSSNGNSFGGAIHNEGSFSLCNNGDVTFSKNTANFCGGAINNVASATFTLCGNRKVSFSGNSVSNSKFDGTNSMGGGAIYNSGTFRLRGNTEVNFSSNITDSYCGGSISNYTGSFSLNGNGSVSFVGNKSSSGGAIFNKGTFALTENGDVTFCGNSSSWVSGAILNNGTFELSDNGDVLFNGNTSATSAGAISHSEGLTFMLRGNGNVSFIRNTASASFDDPYFYPYCYGGAISNSGDFSLIENEDVLFSGNSVATPTSEGIAKGGAIYNSGTYTLRGNGNVRFEKNVEVVNADYRLRSIYSDFNYQGYSPTLNLSASANHSITFYDSIYAVGIVNLNQNGTGDIVFSGATTAADLCEVKGGIAGTAEEILNSRTSEIATNAKLYGGRLIVEEGAILKGRGITLAEASDATIRLSNGILDESGYALSILSGGMEVEGTNIIRASSVDCADGTFLKFVLDDSTDTLLNLDATLHTGQISVTLCGNLTFDRQLISLKNAEQYDTLLWTRENVSVSGVAYDNLVWENGTLHYRTSYVYSPEHDGVLDEEVYDGHDKIVINGNGHTLNVKNEVQLVQMALKNGIVKLEGENNGIVSVTLTEGGELVLTAGAGLKTGDIISMVASGKGELVISGDITLDNKGMKGKAGAQATVSHADAKVLGDATISNVRVEDSTIDLAEGRTVGFEHVVLAATTRITDDPATAKLDDVTAELVLGVNTSLTGRDMLLGNTTLTETGNTGRTLTFPMDTTVLSLEASTFDSLTLSGSSLVLELAGMTLEMFDEVHFIAVSFTGGTDYATFDPSLSVTLSIDGVCYETGYIVESEDKPKKVYFRGGATPEPATATLSLLALAALAARCRRK